LREKHQDFVRAVYIWNSKMFTLLTHLTVLFAQLSAAILFFFDEICQSDGVGLV